MRRCPLTYEIINGNEFYSEKGLKSINRKLQRLKPLPFTSASLRAEAMLRADKMSIQGVQPKLSSVLSLRNECFEIVDKGGHYIMKPQSDYYQQMPENEDLSMHLARIAGVRVPLHGLVYCEDGGLVYFIKRFDRAKKITKYALEDFAQLAEKDRDTKYNASMEQLVPILDQYTTFPMLEKAELFLRVLVNFIIGNEDMHLKNYSLLSKEGATVLAPAYDILNSTIALKNATEEIALPLRGKKRNLNHKDLFDYYASERLQLNATIVSKIWLQVSNAIEPWREWVKVSFLTPQLQKAYLEIIERRLKQLS